MLDYKSIGRRIVYYRKKLSFTQAYVAEQLHVENGYISQIERGVAHISLKRLSEIAEILDVDIALLVSDTNINSKTYGYLELLQIIEFWKVEERDFLIKIVQVFDEYISNNKNK